MNNFFNEKDMEDCVNEDGFNCKYCAQIIRLSYQYQDDETL
jgi:hypothetical protein